MELVATRRLFLSFPLRRHFELRPRARAARQLRHRSGGGLPGAHARGAGRPGPGDPAPAGGLPSGRDRRGCASRPPHRRGAGEPRVAGSTGNRWACSGRGSPSRRRWARG